MMDKCYIFKGGYKNKNYENGIVELPFGSCLKEHNSEKRNRYNNSVSIRQEPKYIVNLECYKVAADGVLTDCKNIESDDLKKANHRKIKTLKSFFGYYESLYKSHKVSMFFLTFTQANMAKMGFSSMLDNVKYRFKALNIPIRGYLWTSEVSKEKGLHWHYHLCIATDRFIFNSVNDLKFDVQWGQRTQISTVKSVHGITKYLSKRQPKIEGYKNFGKSAQFR